MSQFLTLYIDGVPFAEEPFDLPERDKELSREANSRINRQIIEAARDRLKTANLKRINEAERGFEIMVSIKPDPRLYTNNLVGREEKRNPDLLGNNFE